MVCKSQWIARPEDLAPEPHVPVGIEFRVGEHLQTPIDGVNADGQQVRAWPRQKFDLMPRGENHLFRHHLKVKAHLLARVISKPSKHGVIGCVHGDEWFKSMGVRHRLTQTGQSRPPVHRDKHPSIHRERRPAASGLPRQ